MINKVIMTTSFSEWIQKHKPTQIVPEHERIIALISKAEPSGVSWSSLVNTVDLDREIVMQLLRSYVELGWVRASRNGGVLVLRIGDRCGFSAKIS